MPDPADPGTDQGAGSASSEGGAGALLARELYWQGSGDAREAGPLRDLRRRIEGLVDSLQSDLARAFPEDPSLTAGSGIRRWLKRLVYRLIRPLTRRHDRAAAELAAVSLELVDHLGRLEDEIRRLRERLSAGEA